MHTSEVLKADPNALAVTLVDRSVARGQERPDRTSDVYLIETGRETDMSRAGR
jgi:hypothetical protein